MVLRDRLWQDNKKSCFHTENIRRCCAVCHRLLNLYYA